jgi:hypothetical protein
VIPATLENATQDELQSYENNYKALNLITTALGRNVCDHVSHLETAHDVWLKLCNTYEGSSEIKSSHKDTYNRQYHTFSQKPRESLDDCFARFESIVSNLRACGPLAYTDNEYAKQLLYALDDHVWGVKITALEESADFTTLDTEKLFSKLQSHELSHKGGPNHDASFTSKALITSAHDANPTNAVSSDLEFVLSSLTTVSDEQYESIPMTRLLCWQGSFMPCTSSARRGDHPGAALRVAIPLSSSLIAPGGRSLTPSTSTTTPTGMTLAIRATTRRRTTSKTTTIRRSSRRSCPERVKNHFKDNNNKKKF